jgi:hypothetical protein
MADRNSDAAAGRCLRDSLAGLGNDEMERRHEALMAWAEDIGLEREYAEQVYALAEEVELEPIYAFQLVRCGIGVRELEPPEQDADDGAAQQAPPGWVGEESVELDDVRLERRLRATFRRFRTHVAEHGSAVAAVDSFLAEPDVAAQRLVPDDAT